MRSWHLLLCACLLFAAGTHACEAPTKSRKLQQDVTVAYAGSISDCVAMAGLKVTAAVIAAAPAGVTKVFTDGSLSLTFFAPDDATWNSIAKAANTNINELINRPNFAEYFLKNHLLRNPYTTGFWPAPGSPGKYVPNMENAQLQLWSDIQYTRRVMGLYNIKTRLACSKSNLACGRSVMHVIVDPEIPTQR